MIANTEGKVEALQSTLHENKELGHQKNLRVREMESDISALKCLHQRQMEQQQALVEEKHQALLAAQSAQRQLTQPIDQQLATHNDVFEDQMRSLAGAPIHEKYLPSSVVTIQITACTSSSE